MIVENPAPSSLKILIDSHLYNEAVVYKCFYWYGNDYEIDISIGKDDWFEVLITCGQREISEEKKARLISRIKKDLIDFKTRDIISKETQTVRELLIAKAFAQSDEFESQPPGDLSDPVGFSLND